MITIYTVHQKKVYNQRGGTCYAHATAEAIISTELRIIGRPLERHQKIVQRIIAKYGEQGFPVYDVLRQQCIAKSLRCNFVNAYQAQMAVLKGRTVLVMFSLSQTGWSQFSTIFYYYPKASVHHVEQGYQAHAAAIIGIQVGGQGQKSWIVKNAWGRDFADNGTFRIKMYSLPLIFIDVYFTINDLRPSDIRYFEHFQRLSAKGKEHSQLIRKFGLGYI